MKLILALADTVMTNDVAKQEPNAMTLQNEIAAQAVRTVPAKTLITEDHRYHHVNLLG